MRWRPGAHRVGVDVDGGAVGAGGQHLGGAEELGADPPQALPQVGGCVRGQGAELPLDVLGSDRQHTGVMCPLCTGLFAASAGALVCSHNVEHTHTHKHTAMMMRHRDEEPLPFQFVLILIINCVYI